MPYDSDLLALLHQRIRESANGRLTFADYMATVLYAPEHGYYSRGAAIGGEAGDFFTAAHLGSDFGELLAVQFADMWRGLGCPEQFMLVEMGAGQGLVATDVLTYLQEYEPEFFLSLHYGIVETSSVFEQQQREKLAQFGHHVSWHALAELTQITGCFFSNELVDAFAVHRFTIEKGQLREIYVTLSENEILVEVTAEPSTERLPDYFRLVGIETKDFPEGYSSEVNLAALDWLNQVSQSLARGYVLTIDYGYTAARYYQPSRRTGTLLCYHQHTTNDQPYQNIGSQDLTTHVNFTALERYGAQSGLAKLGFTQQGLFLMALGLGERLALLREADHEPLAVSLRRHQALHQLLNPTGLGGFGVLLQAKGLSIQELSYKLRGLEGELR